MGYKMQDDLPLEFRINIHLSNTSCPPGCLVGSDGRPKIHCVFIHLTVQVGWGWGESDTYNMADKQQTPLVYTYQKNA